MLSDKIIESSKRSAAVRAVDYITDGMIVGLGTGSTAEYAIREIANRIRDRELDIIGIPTSLRTYKLAKDLGITLSTLDENPLVDIDIDGADEIDPEFNLIKGGGGAHTMEKRVANNSRLFIIVADSTKLVDRLGKFPVAVECDPSKIDSIIDNLKRLGGKPRLRKNFRTDMGNIILDTKFDKIDTETLEDKINEIDGVIDNGIFSKRRPELIIIGNGNNVRILRKNG